MGVSAVYAAVAGPIAPFFRFPDLQHSPNAGKFPSDSRAA
jgi:hypothetical protein